MVLGIRLEIDKGSVKKASDSIRKAAEKSVAAEQRKSLVEKEKKQIRKEQGIKDPKDNGNGAFGGAALGGFIGAVIGALEPITELLGVIASILKIALVPVLMLMKPFLVLFLKVGLMLLKMFTGPGLQAQAGALTTGRGLQTGEEVGGSAGEAIAGLKERFFGWLDFIFDVQFDSLFGSTIAAFLEVFVSGLGNVFFGFLDVLGGLWDLIIGIFTGDLDRVAQGIVKVFTGIFDIFMGLIKLVVGFFGIVGTLIGNSLVLIWEGIKLLGGIGSWMFEKIKEVLVFSFKVLKNVGSWIKSAIMGFFGGGGGSTTSVNDALITSGGDIVKFNPNDNIIAFQDFSTLSGMGGGSGGGNNITINVDGFVGSEEELADRIGKALNNSSRGSTSNYT